MIKADGYYYSGELKQVIGRLFSASVMYLEEKLVYRDAIMLLRPPTLFQRAVMKRNPLPPSWHPTEQRRFHYETSLRQ